MSLFLYLRFGQRLQQAIPPQRLRLSLSAQEGASRQAERLIEPLQVERLGGFAPEVAIWGGLAVA